MSADPRIVSNARSIPTLTYREVSELAYYGAKVLHPKTMRPVIEHNVPLRIKNTFNPTHPGTVIVKERDVSGSIKAVTAIKDVRLLTVEGKGMLGVVGVAARLFKAVADEHVSVLLISQASSEQSICFAVPSGHSDAIIESIEDEFSEEIKARDIDRVRVQRPVSIVTVVGAGMAGTPGVTGRVFGALSNVNVIAIAQGSSECSISLVVDEANTQNAVTRLHDLIVN
jgi:aspartate kinase